MLLFLASLGYVLAFFWFPSFVTRSNLSSFVTGSSIRAESPLSVVSCLLSHGFASCPFLLVSFLFCSVFSHSFSWLCGFPSASSGLPWGFLYLSSLPVGVPVCTCFVSLPRFCCSLLLGVFPAPFFSSCHFLMLSSNTVAVSLYISFNLLCFLSFCWGRDSGKFSRLLPQVFSFGSSVPLRPLRLALSSIPYGPLCPWVTVAYPLPYRLLCIEPVVMVLVRSLPYRTLFLW